MSTCVAWVFFHLARNPHEYAAAREEALAHPPSGGGGVGQWPRVEGCVLEALRLNPPIDSSVNSFFTAEPVTLFGGTYRLPAGCVVMPMVRRAVRRRMLARWVGGYVRVCACVHAVGVGFRCESERARDLLAHEERHASGGARQRARQRARPALLLTAMIPIARPPSPPAFP